MKLNKKELQNYLTIHADLYKEIVSRERPVAFCIRSITHHNLFESTATITDQQSSSKSDNSEKENNLSKALQRRYHLLYLKAIEVQCMLEGLLEKRKKIKSMAMSINSSDEEPYYKIAKYKHKSNGKEMPMDYQGAATSNSLMTESSSGNDTGHHEGSDSLIDFDIVSHSSISPPLFSDTSCGFENTAECSSSNQSVKSDTLTNFQHSNRKSMNCGTFYYEYKDDKGEQTDMTTSMFSLNSVPITSNQPFRSQRLSHESLRRLRRWLNEMDKRFALAPTLSDAMKLNKKELQNYLTIHADLYKEIVSRERPVAFCIRSITHHNLFESTATITDQQSSSKSDNSEKENNLSKALQRRYHLLYLKAIEVQCMLEGLLEKRKKIKSMAMSMNSSDEEPYYKIAKYKHKSNGKEMPMDYQGAATCNSLMTESSSGNDTGHHEGSDSLIDFDIVSHSSISPPLFSDTSCGFENTAECSSSNQSVKSDTLTNFQHSNRKSMNCGTFYYEYKDDKGEQTDMTTSMVTGTTKSIKSKDDVSERGSMKVTNESGYLLNGPLYDSPISIINATRSSVDHKKLNYIEAV
ncbi:unnamed protein product [Diamesa tonsa]